MIERNLYGFYGWPVRDSKKKKDVKSEQLESFMVFTEPYLVTNKFKSSSHVQQF